MMRILIIEDDKRTAEFIEAGFREEGFSCTIAYDGEDGLRWARAESFDVATVDIMLPGLDGIALIRRLRKEGSRLPIVVLSARGGVDDKILGLNAGGDDYLSKPFSISELVARVQALLRRTQGIGNPSSLTYRDLTLDLLSRKVTRSGRKIELQPLELQLLEYLMRNMGRVVSRTTIMEHVWDYDFDPKTNVVDARVCHLREKLGPGPDGKPLIRTVRRFGYAFGE